MKILALGDVVGTRAVSYLKEKLWRLRQAENIRFVVANGENATEIRGLSAADASALWDAGVDVITLGNHTFGVRDLYPLLENDARIVRPANYPPEVPGTGYTVVDADSYRALVINVSGRAFLDPLADPFLTVDRILEREKGNYDFSVLDIHAEATGEKYALARYFDGRISVIFGTHTHVPTADEQVLPGGTGYVTDLGMCGPDNGVLGVDAATVIRRFRTMMPEHFTTADGAIEAMGVLFTVNESTGKTESVRRVKF